MNRYPTGLVLTFLTAVSLFIHPVFLPVSRGFLWEGTPACSQAGSLAAQENASPLAESLDDSAGDSVADSGDNPNINSDEDPVRVMIFQPRNLGRPDAAVSDGHSEDETNGASQNLPEAEPAEESPENTDLIREYEEFLRSISENEIRAAGYEALRAREWSAYESRGGDPFGLLPVDIAGERNADIALSVYFRLESPRIFLMVKAYDVRTRRIIGGNVQVARDGLVLVNSMDRLMDSVIGQIDQAREEIQLMRSNPGMLAGTSPASVLFRSAQEDVEVDIPGVGPAGKIENGSLTLPYQPLALGQQLLVEVSGEGYYPRQASYALNAAENEFDLPQLYPRTRFATEFVYNFWTLAGGGMALRYYFQPDMIFLRLSNHIFVRPGDALGLGGGRMTVHDDVMLEFGSYLLFGPESPFRAAYSGGFGAMFSSLDTGITAVDAYINLAALHWEWNLPRGALFLRQDLRYALGIFSPRIFPQGTDIAPVLIPLTLGVLIKW
ncbi:hypothetical protein [Salinispira pacifica]|uniref:hypothetical protein n=1 Tax=Salinispira pacifica TaxID=1307761 RepID=UPI000427AA96|nr:hypothetical protein [Salinispira pacifica]